MFNMSHKSSPSFLNGLTSPLPDPPPKHQQQRRIPVPAAAQPPPPTSAIDIVSWFGSTENIRISYQPYLPTRISHHMYTVTTTLAQDLLLHSILVSQSIRARVKYRARTALMTTMTPMSHGLDVLALKTLPFPTSCPALPNAPVPSSAAWVAPSRLAYPRTKNSNEKPNTTVSVHARGRTDSHLGGRRTSSHGGESSCMLNISTTPPKHVSPARSQSMPLMENPSPTPSLCDSAVSSRWNAAKNRLTPTKEPRTAAQQFIQETMEKEKREIKEAKKVERERKRSQIGPPYQRPSLTIRLCSALSRHPSLAKRHVALCSAVSDACGSRSFIQSPT
jgi:hypothetical protein